MYGCVCVCVCVCMYGFCNLWMRLSGFLMCGCSDNCVFVLEICVLVFTVFLYCFFYSYLFLFVTRVRTTPTK
jgi:hypothetical protein